MPGSQDPSAWQQFLDSRFIQTLVLYFSAAVAFGLAIGRYVKRFNPETREDAELKRRLETGAWQEIAHQLSELQKGQAELGERVAKIEGYLESDKGA